MGWVGTPTRMTTIYLEDDTADELHDLKDRGDSYNDVVQALLDAHNHRLSDAEPSRVPEDAPRNESGDPKEL